MDYKELYEGVLERAKKEYNMHKDNHAIGIIDTIERIFPNINKSKEDEIREFLYNLISSLAWRKDWPDNKKDCLVWLEKQGEQTATKPTDLRTWKYIVDAVLTKREGIGQYIDSPWVTEVAEKLQKRFGNIEQRPVEWSEEDDIMVENVRNSFGLHCGQMTEALKEQYDKFFNKVKSLRPQKHWKPSEEQMKELGRSCNGLRTDDKGYEVLWSLYKQLKALQEGGK